MVCRMQRDAYDGAWASTSAVTPVDAASDPAAVIQHMAQVCGHVQGLSQDQSAVQADVCRAAEA